MQKWHLIRRAPKNLSSRSRSTTTQQQAGENLNGPVLVGQPVSRNEKLDPICQTAQRVLEAPGGLLSALKDFK